METLNKAQAKIQDPRSGNFVYVRSYNEGHLHSVVVTKEGVVEGYETFDHGLITHFAERYAGRRDSFEVVWEKEKASMNRFSAQTASTGISNGETPSIPAATDKMAPSLKNVKTTLENNSNFQELYTICCESILLKSSPPALSKKGK